MRINLKKIQGIEWYHQGGAIRLFYSFGPYQGMSKTIGYDRNIIYQKGELNKAFFDREIESDKFWRILVKQSKDRGFIDRQIKSWQRKSDELHKLCRSFFSDPLEGWSDKKLILFLNSFNRLAADMWAKSFVIEWSDPEGVKLLKMFLDKYNADISNEKLDILISPSMPNFKQREFLNRYKIAKKIAQHQDITRVLQAHTRKYFTINSTWAYINELNREDFLKMASKLASNLGAGVRRAQEIEKQYRSVKQAQTNFQRSKTITIPAKNVIYMFSRMAQWRDKRKLISMAIPNSYLAKILKHLAKENKVDFDSVGRLTFKEINGWRLNKNALDAAEARNRGAIYICNDAKDCSWIYGLQAEKVYKILTDIRKSSKDKITGVSARKGLARGKVKLVELAEDFDKVEKGDVLVAHMTRPEYMPILHMASAIITDEGGLTCHAAIVSRELGIPCIVGTQSATAKLKDGDLVEVDANKGEIKIIR